MNAKISFQIITLITNGASLEEAINSVLGAGAYGNLVDELYDELRAKAGLAA